MLEFYVLVTLLGLGTILNYNRPVHMKPPETQRIRATDAPSMMNPYDSRYATQARAIEAEKAHTAFQAALKNPDKVVPQERAAFSAPPPPKVRSKLADVDFDTEHFTHNNMTPFFGGTMKQNTAGLEKLGGRFEAFTGQSEYYTRKQEREPLFRTTADLTNVMGMGVNTEFYKSRVDAPKLRNNELPVPQVRVAPAVNKGFTAEGTGGFHQQDILDYVRPKTVDELRVLTNPKVTYDGRIVDGQRGSRPAKMGKMAQHRPSTLYEQTPDHLLRTTGANLAAKQRPAVDAKHTHRQDTSACASYQGPAYKKVQGTNTNAASLVQPSHRNQLAGLGITNPALATQGTGSKFDHGKDAVLIYDNNRVVTQACPPKQGNLTSLVKAIIAPVEDLFRVTRKETTEDAVREGILKPQQPSKATIYDPNQVLRTTVKETTLHDGGHVVIDACRTQGGIAYDAKDIAARTTGRETLDPLDTSRNLDGGEDKGYVRDPNDKTRTTMQETTLHDAREGSHLTAVDQQRGGYTDAHYDAKATHKEILTQVTHIGPHSAQTRADGYKVANPEAPVTQRELVEKQEYFGAADSAVEQRSMSYEDIYNATLNELREVVLTGREPTQTSVKVASGSDAVTLDVRRQVLDHHQAIPKQDRPSTVAIPDNMGEVTKVPQLQPGDNDRLDITLLKAFHENPYTHSFEDIA